MSPNLTSEQVWRQIEKQIFGVLGLVTAKGEARTVGVVYIVHNRQLFISTQKQAWKTRHIAQNPSVSFTIPIHKQIPFLPWIQIPAATITFSGEATVQDAENISREISHKLHRGQEGTPFNLQDTAVISIQPNGEFITYGVGVSLMDMRFPEKAQGRATVK